MTVSNDILLKPRFAFSFAVKIPFSIPLLTDIQRESLLEGFLKNKISTKVVHGKFVILNQLSLFC